jgi:hypothetical protein
MQPEPQVTTHRQDRVRTGRKVGQHPSELGECLQRLQLVQIIDDQRDPAAAAASSASTLSTIAGPLKSGVAASGSAWPETGEA